MEMIEKCFWNIKTKSLLPGFTKPRQEGPGFTQTKNRPGVWNEASSLFDYSGFESSSVSFKI